MQGRLWRGTVRLVAVGVVALFAVQTGGFAAATSEAQSSAAAPAASASSFAQTLRALATSELVVGDEAAGFVARANARIARTGLHLSTGDSLDTARAETIRLRDGSTLVRVPIVGTTTIGSAVGVLFDTKGVEHSMSEMALHEVSKYSGRLQLWSNGRLLLDQVVVATADPEPEVSAKFSWRVFWDCMEENIGAIPWWVKRAVVVACAVACGSGPIGCVGCVTAVTAVSATIAFACAQRAS